MIKLYFFIIWNISIEISVFCFFSGACSDGIESIQQYSDALIEDQNAI